MKLKISPRRTTILLTLGVLFMVPVNLIGILTIAGWQFGQQVELIAQLLAQLVLVFALGSDTSIPTWYSSVALLLCSVLLTIIAAAKKLYGESYTLHWGGFLSSFCCYPWMK